MRQTSKKYRFSKAKFLELEAKNNPERYAEMLEYYNCPAWWTSRCDGKMIRFKDGERAKTLTIRATKKFPIKSSYIISRDWCEEVTDE